MISLYKDLKDNQIEILLFIKKFTKLNGFPPTIREISDATKIKSTSTVHMELKILESLGYITRNGSKSRGLEINSDKEDEVLRDRATFSIPVIKEITVSSLLSSIGNIKGTFPIAADLLTTEDYFAYVADREFKELAINVGDLLIFSKQSNFIPESINLVYKNFSYELTKKLLNDESSPLGVLEFIFKQFGRKSF